VRSVGIVGLPGAGATTVFTALTAVPGSASHRTHQAVVPVPDDRLPVLARLEGSRATRPAAIRFVEAGSLVRRGARGIGSLPAELLGILRECDALVAVVRAFGDEADPAGDLAALEVELALADLAVIAAKLERDAKAARAGDAEARRLLPVLERARDALDAGRALREVDWTDEERRALAALAPLTLKPRVVLANVGEAGPTGPLPEGAVPVAAALEAEVAGMEPAEADELLASYGVTERGVARVVRAVYESLDLVTFLTAGEKEARAWPVRRGTRAPEAAGVVHSDFERGFIRADVVPFPDLVAAGGWAAARARGLVRQEGRSYVVREGDVIEFRFAV
jgi:ribosome-binding ATPase YchF (GTP1/OBG family)